MKRGVWNFSAGPAALPEEVATQIASELPDWSGSGQSPLEFSHRGDEFLQILQDAQQSLRSLLHIPDQFDILFLQGGATVQTAMIPLNLIGRHASRRADCVVTGRWSRRFYEQCSRYGTVRVAADNQQSDSEGTQSETWLPDFDTWDLNPQASFLHYCANETIAGLQYTDIPDLKSLGAHNTILVQDATSDFLSRPLDFERLGMVYASAQKNAGIAGLTIAIINRDCLGFADDLCPDVFNYQNISSQNSLVNTPPTFAIYVAGLVFKWLFAQGGIQAIQPINAQKAALLYNCIDESGIYFNQVPPQYRSQMNVPFKLKHTALTELFLKQAGERGLLNLAGHRTAGGIRASIYNAMPLQGVKELVAFMKEFEQKNG